MRAQRVRHGSKNVKNRKTESERERERQHTYRQAEGSRGTDGGEEESGRCVGSDPYWPHQALAGRCTPRSGRRSRRAAGRRPRSAACRAFPQTASCLLDGKRGRGREERGGRKEGVWKREQTNATADGTVLLSWTFISSLLCWALAAAAAVIVVDLTVVWCATPP